MPSTAETLRLSDERSLHLVRDGSARSGRAPILLIHGAFATSQDWLAGPFGRLAARSEVVAVDRPGHGLSDRPRFAAEPHDQARQIREGVKQLGLGPALVVGHSFGALVALAYAELFPAATGGLLLVAPAVFQEFRPVEHLIFAPRAAPVVGPLAAEICRWTFDPWLLRALQQAMFWPKAPPPEWLDTFPYQQQLSPEQLVREGEDSIMLAPGSPRVCLDFAAITAPVHILAGEKDQVTDPMRQAMRLHRRIRSSGLTLLPGVGHMAHHSAMAEFLALAEEMLAKIPEPSCGLGSLDQAE